MSHDTDPVTAVTLLWEEHRSAPFPPGLAGADRAGFDLVLVDSDITGCVHTWLSNAGTLDEWRYRVLHRRGDQLGEILTVLGDGDCPAYWDRLFRMAELVASTDPRPRDAYPPEPWTAMDSFKDFGGVAHPVPLCNGIGSGWGGSAAWGSFTGTEGQGG